MATWLFMRQCFVAVVAAVVGLAVSGLPLSVAEGATSWLDGLLSTSEKQAQYQRLENKRNDIEHFLQVLNHFNTSTFYRKGCPSMNFVSPS